MTAARINGVIDAGSVEAGTVDEGDPGDGGPGDSDERLAVTGGTAELELVAFVGLAVSAGFILLMLTRLRRQPA